MKRRDFLTTGSQLTAGFPLLLKIRFENSEDPITLIGDSIRVGYEAYVALYLNRQVEVWGPDNQRVNSFDILEEAESWFKNRNAHIIHINTGLEDLKCLPFSQRENLIPVDLYSRNIEKIIKYIHRVCPGSIQIWATTTPVIYRDPESRQEENTGFSYYPGDINSYNEAMIITCRKLGVPVNDLYQFVMSGEPSRIMLEDGIHFTDMGYELIGEQVANAIQVFME